MGDAGIALVTGRAGGLGKSIAPSLAKDGLRLAISDLDAAAAAPIAAELGHFGHVENSCIRRPVVAAFYMLHLY